MKDAILSHLSTACPWRDTLYCLDTIDSTNDRAKAMAEAGASHGTVILANAQTKGRGRMGRNFHSEGGKGIYMSFILRPDCPAASLMHLTCAVAVAIIDAVASVTGYRPGIKWINDLVAQGKKLGGILTELSIQPDGFVSYAIVGVGINCTQKEVDFPSQIRDIAISLETVTGKPVCREALCAALIQSMADISAQLISEKEAIMARYKENCVTLYRDVVLLQGNTSQVAKAIDLDSNGTLVVQLSDGTNKKVLSGEVSIRGFLGYC